MLTNVNEMLTEMLMHFVFVVLTKQALRVHSQQSLSERVRPHSECWKRNNNKNSSGRSRCFAEKAECQLGSSSECSTDRSGKTMGASHPWNFSDPGIEGLLQPVDHPINMGCLGGGHGLASFAAFEKSHVVCLHGLLHQNKSR